MHKVPQSIDETISTLSSHDYVCGHDLATVGYPDFERDLSILHMRAPACAAALSRDIVAFVHALRKAGITVGTSQVTAAVSALAVAGYSTREVFFYTLRATLVTRPEQLEVFAPVFAMFWRETEFSCDACGRDR